MKHFFLDLEVVIALLEAAHSILTGNQFRRYTLKWICLSQGCTTCGPRAGSGPRTCYIRCGMKMCPAWSAVRKTSNINIDGPAAPTFVARTDYHTTYV